MATEIWVNIGSGNGLLPDGTKSLPEPMLTDHQWSPAEMCSERDSPLKRLYRRTHAKLTRLAGSGQLVWATGCELSLALIHARQPAWPGETSETILWVARTCKTRPPDHTRVNWPVDASASGSAQVGPGGHHRWAARVQVDQEPARQKAREGYPFHYTSLSPVTFILWQFHKRCLNHQSLKSVWKLHVWNFIQISQGPMS